MVEKMDWKEFFMVTGIKFLIIIGFLGLKGVLMVTLLFASMDVRSNAAEIVSYIFLLSSPFYTLGLNGIILDIVFYYVMANILVYFVRHKDMRKRIIVFSTIFLVFTWTIAFLSRISLT